jgi:hypothetical protein
MKTFLIGKKCDIQNILSIGSNYLFKPSTVFSTLMLSFLSIHMLMLSCRDAGANASSVLYM